MTGFRFRLFILTNDIVVGLEKRCRVGQTF